MMYTRFAALATFIALAASAFALPMPAEVQLQHLASRHGGIDEVSNLFELEVARIAALQARDPSPSPEPVDRGFEPDFKRSDESDILHRAFERIIAYQRREASPEPEPAKITIEDREASASASASLDAGDEPDLLSVEIERISSMIRARNTETVAVAIPRSPEPEPEEAEELLRRELERIAGITAKRDVEEIVKREPEPEFEFKRTEEGEELLKREVERIATLTRHEPTFDVIKSPHFLSKRTTTKDEEVLRREMEERMTKM